MSTRIINNLRAPLDDNKIPKGFPLSANVGEAHAIVGACGR